MEIGFKLENELEIRKEIREKVLNDSEIISGIEEKVQKAISNIESRREKLDDYLQYDDIPDGKLSKEQIMDMLKTQFIEEEVEKEIEKIKKNNARRYLSNKFKGDSKWFYDLLEKIDKLREEGEIITDLLILEDKGIYGSTGKRNWPLSNAKISREHISELVRIIDSKITQLPQKDDLNFAIAIFGYGTFRFNLSLDDSGYGLAIRVLPYKIPKPREINYNKRIFKIFNSIIENDYISRGGLVVHVGPTGAGKTTSIAVELDYISKKISGTILTYENPPEYRFDLNRKAQVRQFEIGVHLSDYEVALRHLLRNNPSVCFIGEIQTSDELEKVVDIGSRGHLTFTTLHGNNVFEALKFLSDLESEVSRKRMASNLIAVIAHRQVLFTYDGELAKEKGLYGKVGIYPIFEIYQPDRNDIANLSKGELDKVRKSFYEDINRNSNLVRLKFSESFNHSFDELKRKGYITQDNFEKLRASLTPLFEDKAKAI